jgi:hypothetical protein
MTVGIGIDLNGLSDAAAFDAGATDVVGGAIPSVVVLLGDDAKNIELNSGAEATNSMIGRGWDWPASAVVDDAGLSRRIPISEVISCLEENREVATSIGKIDPAVMLAAGIRSLAEARGAITDTPVIVAIPDDIRFDEEARQKILNALEPTGMRIQLLWRPVAALLGMAKDINQLAEQLAGKPIGVVSLLNEGISASILELRKFKSKSNQPYVIPKRTREGIFVPFDEPILELAKQNADKIMSSYGENGWQVLWGNGFILRHLLRLENYSPIVKIGANWEQIPVEEIEKLSDISVSEEVIDRIDEFLANVQLLVYEGPALETPVDGDRLMNRVSDVLYTGIFERDTGRNRQSIGYLGNKTQLVAHGSFEYARRQADEEITYYDHLPQIELAVRRGDEPVFRSLIDLDDEVEGGKAYDKSKDLDLVIPKGAQIIEFYILREGNNAPRRATIDLPTAIINDIPVQMNVHQFPAQGRARLRLESLDPNFPLRPIYVDWSSMEVLEGETRDDILERLRDSGITVPPVQYQPCHPILWVAKRGTDLLAKSVADHVDEVFVEMKSGAASNLVDRVKALREAVYPFRSPYDLTRYRAEPTHSEKANQRVVSSEGEVPLPDEGLQSTTIQKFRDILDLFGEMIDRTDVRENRKLTDQIVLFGSWTFKRCPPQIRAYLQEKADTGIADQNSLREMGRCFSSASEIRSLHTAIYEGIEINNWEAKEYHVYALFYIMSLREDAPFYLEELEARAFVNAALKRIEAQIRKQKYSRLVRTCIKAIGGLIRYRLVDSEFLSSDEYLGDQVKKLLEKLMQRSKENPRRKAIYILASDVLDALERRGASASILEWDPD